MKKPSVVIVGAGTGGIATAARLARDGFRVTVLEQHDFLGGRCSLQHRDGYRFDQGPSLLLMREIFSETFDDLGTSLEAEGVELLQCDPNYCIWFSDHDTLEMSSNLSKLKREVVRLEGPQGFSKLLDLLKETGRYYDLTVQYVLRRHYPSLRALLCQPNVFGMLLAMRPWTTMYGRAQHYFTSTKMRQAWTFASMYMGMSPYEAPGTYALLQCSETVDGIWYPRGGFQRVLQALADIGQTQGVEYRLRSPVARILLSDDQHTARGVRLHSGEEILADVVIVNADLVYAYTHLLPPCPYAAALTQRATSCSSISFFWAVDTPLPQLRPHNIFLAEHYRESFDAIFIHHSIPADPSFYVNVPSRIDPTAAPEGKEALVVLVPVGSLRSSGEGSRQDEWGEEIVAHTRELVLRTIESRTGIRNLSAHILHENSISCGAILGLSHSFGNMLNFRPAMKHASISGLYFVGASTHPGTGVPIWLTGAKLVAQLVKRDVDGGLNAVHAQTLLLVSLR
ncbi:phytoene desaturase family protein [Aspergillus aculeatinus CBS 121060]|uniref:Phytoene dehydrogenase n=1 Tax=Aspergillus aculeatinus CBS 121060 TaxID=1448322 RepID=A0ACD1GX06_9EURO|nr:phytoene dehydrogenase [Aspergillus aculeatinus CBS 121060]RAH65672.1 phytoene dehydrogenase [Aspergillus aculeatinus CBS 121060]